MKQTNPTTPKSKIQSSQYNVFNCNRHIYSNYRHQFTAIHCLQGTCPPLQNGYHPVLNSPPFSKVLYAGNGAVNVTLNIGATDNYNRGIGDKLLIVSSLGQPCLNSRFFHDFESPWLR